MFHVKQGSPGILAPDRGAEPPPSHRLPPPAAPPLDARTAQRLDDLLDLLLRWNTRINLIAERDPQAIQARHILDSLQLLGLLPSGDGPIGDLGSGGGFPGLVLAIASGRTTHLVESDRRKAAFLTEAAGRLGLRDVHVHAERIEAVALPPLAILTARALAPLSRLLPHAARLLAPDGVAIFPKGRTAEAELTEALTDWRVRTERFASQTDPEATIFRLSDIRRAGPDA